MRHVSTLLSALLACAAVFILTNLVGCDLASEVPEETALALEVLPPGGVLGDIEIPDVDDPMDTVPDPDLEEWCTEQLAAGVCDVCETVELYCAPRCENPLEPCLSGDPLACLAAQEACARCELCADYKRAPMHWLPVPNLQLDPHTTITDPPPPGPGDPMQRLR